MVTDLEQKTIAEMAEAMAEILNDNGINPMQSMNLVGYAARKLVTDICKSVCLESGQGVIIALGGMLPKDYLVALCESSKSPHNGCNCAK